MIFHMFIWYISIFGTLLQIHELILSLLIYHRRLEKCNIAIEYTTELNMINNVHFFHILLVNSQQIMNKAHVPSPDSAGRKQSHVLIASTISCVAAMTLINPLQVAKLRAQYSPVSCPQYPHPTFKQLNNCECTKFNITDSFKGLSVSLFHGLISNTLYMQFYEYQRQLFIKSMPSGLATLSAALSSRLMVTTIMIPIQAFRVRFTNSTQNDKITTVKSGLKATLARDLTYSCLYWFTIEQIRNLLMGAQYRTQKNNKNVLYANVIPAMVGGSLISAITTPLDTIKTRQQSGVPISGSLISMLKSIYQKQGYIGLFSGVQHRVVRNTVSSVIYLTIFEHILDYLQSPHKYFSDKDNAVF